MELRKNILRTIERCLRKDNHKTNRNYEDIPRLESGIQ